MLFARIIMTPILFWIQLISAILGLQLKALMDVLEGEFRIFR